MNACDGSIVGMGVGAFVGASAPMPDAPMARRVYEQPACLQTLRSPWCIGTNEAMPP